MAIQVGDKVQIKPGGRDVTNGVTAKKGRMYGQGGPYWATVEKIVKGWKTGGKWGLPKTVTKYRCSNKGVVVWQVQEKDLIPKTVHKEKKKAKKKQPKPKRSNPTKKSTVGNQNRKRKIGVDDDTGTASSTYAPWDEYWGDWKVGDQTIPLQKSVVIKPKGVGTPQISESMFSKHADWSTPKWEYAHLTFRNYYGGANGGRIDISLGNNKVRNNGSGWSGTSWRENAKRVRKYTAKSIYVPRVPYKAKFLTSYSEKGRKYEMLNAEYDNGLVKASSRIQNASGFPKWTGKRYSTAKYGRTKSNSNGTEISARFGRAYKYNYQIIPGDPDLDGDTLEDALTKVRKSFGIIIPADNDIARSAKFYLYNRFKVPDISLAHNKTITHVFFTRPDLNIVNPKYATGESNRLAADQVLDHTETAMTYRRFPELFKLLADRKRVWDDNNFNLLLSNQVSSFSLEDETLATTRHGKSWREYEMQYGQNYTGRYAGTFSCTFDETSEYSILNMIKLWMTYIDNVSTGAWSPNYYYLKDGLDKGGAGGEFDHVTNRDLDYGASVYVFKCGPDGEDVLYWTKYFGVFPISSGASALSWERSAQIGSTPSLNISFAYSAKRDMSPVSLLEFNDNANISEEEAWIPGYVADNAGSYQPFVGCPYIQFRRKTPDMSDTKDGVYTGERMSIRLKFKEDPDTANQRSDKQLYTSHSGIVDWKTNVQDRINTKGGSYNPDGTYVSSGKSKGTNRFKKDFKGYGFTFSE